MKQRTREDIPCRIQHLDVIIMWAAWKFEASNQIFIAKRALTLATIYKEVQPHDINDNFERFLNWQTWVHTHCTKWTWTFFEYQQIVDRTQNKQPATSPPNNLQRVPTASSRKFWKFQLEMSRHGSTQRCGLPVRPWAWRSFQVYRLWHRWCTKRLKTWWYHGNETQA